MLSPLQAGVALGQLLSRGGAQVKAYGEWHDIRVLMLREGDHEIGFNETPTISLHDLGLLLTAEEVKF